MSDRLDVRKTYKLYIGGEFVRSESGRSYEVVDSKGTFLTNAVRASRKDLRDAVRSARSAQSKWGALTAYNRGQVLYRVAEMMEARREQFVEEVTAAEGEGAEVQVADAIDTWVWYAGLADKLSQITGNLNEVNGPYFNITSPEPTGVIGIVAVERPSLAGLVTQLAPVLCGGNAAVVLASHAHPLPSIALAESLATADVPGGVANVLTGFKDELTPVLAEHGDVDGIDVTGVGGDLVEVESAAAGNVKRVVARAGQRSPYEVTAFMEMKTVWHPKGV